MSYSPENREVGRLDETGLTARSPRTNLLLSATIEATDITAPVRIRNLSDTGALLEGSALPKAGAHLVLKRMNLEMGGTVIWCEGSRCGVAFEGTISVAGWRTGTWIEAVGTVGQTRVDNIQAAVRAGSAGPDAGVHPLKDMPKPSAAEIDIRIAQELTALRHILEQMGEKLSDEPVIVQQYPSTIQGFDLTCQILGHLADILKARDRNIAMDAVGMQELRDRLTGRPPSEG